MSITLPPLPDPNYENHYGGAQMDAHAFAAIAADRASRVPMSEAKIIEMLDEGYSGTVSLVRMVEAHHDIGVEL